MMYAEAIIVTCGCGNFPLEKAMHPNSAEAWRAAADHVALNPTKCKPRMFRDLVPAALHPSVQWVSENAAPLAMVA